VIFRAAPGPARRGEPGRMVIFRAGGERFALPLEAVREVVVPRPPFARVPRAGPEVRGAMNLRGHVVAMVELAALVGLAPAVEDEGPGHVLLLDRERRGLGLRVSGVLGVERLRVASAAPPGAAARELAAGVAEASSGVVTVLDPAALEERAAAAFGAPPPSPSVRSGGVG
jgi:purine-binding chemotaxis protein CheW